MAALTYLPPEAPGTHGEKLHLAVVEGEGRRAGRANAAAKRAGLDRENALPFDVEVTKCRMADPPVDIAVAERTFDGASSESRTPQSPDPAHPAC